MTLCAGEAGSSKRIATDEPRRSTEDDTTEGDSDESLATAQRDGAFLEQAKEHGERPGRYAAAFLARVEIGAGSSRCGARRVACPAVQPPGRGPSRDVP